MVKTAKFTIVLATIGTLGDLHPFIALGRALAARGVAVVIATAADYRPKVERAGLAFRPVRPSFADMERQLGMNRAEVTRLVLRRSDFLFRKLIVPSVRMSYEDMLPIIEGADLVLTSTLSFGARLACERHGVPWIGIVLQPLMFFSAYDPPVIPGAEWLRGLFRRLGPSATGRVLGIVKRAVGGLLGPVHALRSEIGLAPSRTNPLFEGQFSAGGAIGLYSTVLGDIRADYPRPSAIVGFASFDSADGGEAALEAELQDFLAAGPPPLVFTLGSLVVNSPGSFYHESVGAARRLGMRAVLLVGEQTRNAHTLRAADVCVCAYAPHSLLFPRAAAIVHQGGVGTLAEALRSARPHLVVPFFADQLDNAARAVRLGVARSLTPAGYTAAAAARELALLTTRDEFRARARDVRELLNREGGAAEAADVVLNRLESLLR
jgi:rhamnosyltransferase subunit B